MNFLHYKIIGDSPFKCLKFWRKNPAKNPRLKLICNVNIVLHMERFCPETSTKLYVHEFGFWLLRWAAPPNRLSRFILFVHGTAIPQIREILFIVIPSPLSWNTGLQNHTFICRLLQVTYTASIRKYKIITEI
jgi:hypothetical protein